MTNIIDVSDTIQAKSDQLNAVDIAGAPITVTVTSVNKTASPDQPLTVRFEGDNGRPFKPSKTCRRILVQAWGRDANNWIGKSMTLFCDHKVRWAGQEIGGVRISHMSGIDKTMNFQLPVSRGKYDKYTIEPLKQAQETKQTPQKKPYTDEQLAHDLPNMQKSLDEKRSTQQGFIDHLQKKFVLTGEQIKKILDLAPTSTPDPENQEPTETF